MAFELMTYGLLAGLMYQLLPKKAGYTYVALLIALVGGRLVWGIISVAIYGLSGSAFGWSAFFAGAVIEAIPGIVLQIILVPAVVLIVRRITRTNEKSLLFEKVQE